MKTVSLSIYKSLGLHVVLGGMLVVSMEFHSPVLIPEVQMPDVQPIQAQVVDATEVQEQLDRVENQRRAAENERQRKIEETKRKQRQAAEAKKKKAEREKAEKERKRKEKERKEREAEEKRKEEARKEKERLEKQKKEQERKERLEQERIMNEQLEAERLAQQRRNSQKVQSEVQKYTALVKSKIMQNWIIDDTMRGKSCRLNIRLATNGLVLQVKVLEGDPTVCRTSETAVLKAVSLPVSSDPDVFKEFRNFNLTMSPEIR